MIVPKVPWPAVLLALAAAVGMLLGGVGAGLSAIVAVLWIGTLMLARQPATDVSRERIAEHTAPERLEHLIEALHSPLLVLQGNRIALANAAARTALGAHLVGQDARMALRHPEAVELFERGGTAEIAGLTGPKSLWQITCRRIEEGLAVVELVDRSGEADVGRAHTDFVANASHELSTPLAAIIGYVETLQEDPSLDRATTSRFHATLLRESKRLQTIVADLMSLSRIEAERHDRPRERVDVAPLVASVVSDVGSPRLSFEPPQALCEVSGDRAQLDQLVRNLVDNALKYGEAAEPVTIALHQEDGRIVLRIADRGPGIAPEHLPLLTRRFYRTDPGRSRAAGGTGLGLAIVKHIAERHRAQLDIASTLGVGTTVTVRFPRWESDDAALS